jgi:hypothetical protein
MGSRYLYGNRLLNKTMIDWKQSLIESRFLLAKLPLDYHLTKQNSEKVKMLDR